MQMYEAFALGEDMQTEVYRKVLFAEDADDAIDRLQEEMREKKLAYGVCMAEAIE